MELSMVLICKILPFFLRREAPKWLYVATISLSPQLINITNESVSDVLHVWSF